MSGLTLDSNEAAFNMQCTTSEQFDRLRIRDLFFLEDPRRKAVGRVLVEDRARALQDDRAGVVLGVDEVNGAAADLATVRQDGFVHAPAVHAASTEGRQQRRVNVNDFARVFWGNVKQA